MKKYILILKRLTMIFLYILISIIISTILVINLTPSFGSNAKGEYKDKIKNSINFKNGKFTNLVKTDMSTGTKEQRNNSIKKIMFGSKTDRLPQNPIKTIKFNKSKFKNENDSFSWLGHSTVIMKLNNKTILIDPVYNRASPFSFLGPKPFPMTNASSINDLPSKIDFVLITHDHYDHLDYKTIKKIHKTVNEFLVPLGVKSHLIKWGVDKNKIKEFDWYENTTLKNIQFTFTPTRHFSGRGITNRDSSLWGSWVIKSKLTNVFFSGDSGYFDEFKKIGEKFGPFDITFIENGQYNEAWKNIHMAPEESVKAAIDLKSKLAVPIHWGKFSLSIHSWQEPANRFFKEANKQNLNYASPLIGEIFFLNQTVPKSNWWNN